jgi:hypothetical protein
MQPRHAEGSPALLGFRLGEIQALRDELMRLRDSLNGFL